MFCSSLVAKDTIFESELTRCHNKVTDISSVLLIPQWCCRFSCSSWRGVPAVYTTVPETRGATASQALQSERGACPDGAALPYPRLCRVLLTRRAQDSDLTSGKSENVQSHVKHVDKGSAIRSFVIEVCTDKKSSRLNDG